MWIFCFYSTSHQNREHFAPLILKVTAFGTQRGFGENSVRSPDQKFCLSVITASVIHCQYLCFKALLSKGFFFSILSAVQKPAYIPNSGVGHVHRIVARGNFPKVFVLHIHKPYFPVCLFGGQQLPISTQILRNKSLMPAAEHTQHLIFDGLLQCDFGFASQVPSQWVVLDVF